MMMVVLVSQCNIPVLVLDPKINVVNAIACCYSLVKFKDFIDWQKIEIPIVKVSAGISLQI